MAKLENSDEWYCPVPDDFMADHQIVIQHIIDKMEINICNKKSVDEMSFCVKWLKMKQRLKYCITFVTLMLTVDLRKKLNVKSPGGINCWIRKGKNFDVKLNGKGAVIMKMNCKEL